MHLFSLLQMFHQLNFFCILQGLESDDEKKENK